MKKSVKKDSYLFAKHGLALASLAATVMGNFGEAQIRQNTVFGIKVDGLKSEK
jgi:hypothetical protein